MRPAHLFAVAVAAFALNGCGGSGGTPATPAAPTSTAPPTSTASTATASTATASTGTAAGSPAADVAGLRVSGVVDVPGLTTSGRAVPREPCVAERGQDDAVSGAKIVLTTVSGTALSTSDLGDGRFAETTQDPSSSGHGRCEFAFDFGDVQLGDATAFQVTFANRPAVTYRRDQLAAPLHLALG